MEITPSAVGVTTLVIESDESAPRVPPLIVTSLISNVVLRESVTAKLIVIGASPVTSPESTVSDEINIVGEVPS